jgi:allantoate deiminase
MVGAGRGARVMARLDVLAGHSATPDGLTRLYLTPEHRAAALLVAAWMREAGMIVRFDAVGNVIGRRDGGRPELPALLLGSHIDTVRHAGKYDGALGVVVAIEAVAALGADLDYAIEVIAFGDEEGVRFPVTLTGSRALAGTLQAAALDVRDTAGISIRAALEAFAEAPLTDLAALAYPRDRVLGYCEVHIEQGPVLEAAGLAVGVVSAIAGASRHRVTLEGRAGHAGTVPMALRHDPVCAAAEMILAAEAMARERAGLVMTTGMIGALPGAMNVIAGRADFTLDIRHGDDAVRARATAALRGAMAEIAERRGVVARIEDVYEAKAAPCAPQMVSALCASVARCGVAPMLVPSGAGHDGLAMIDLCPIGMLFVRCKGGISHHPDEQVCPADVEAAVAVLIDFLSHFPDDGVLA